MNNYSTLTFIIAIVVIMFNNPIFGGRSDNNQNTSIKRNNSNGTIENNRNCDIDTSNSQVDIKDNANSNVKIKESVIVFLNSKNCNVKGARNKFSIEDCINCQISGNDNSATIKSNANFNFKNGNKLHCDASDNKNMKIGGSEAEIKAYSNKNVNIGGDHFNLTVSNVSNHNLQGKNCTDGVHTLECIPNSNVNGGSPQYKIKFCNSAQISGKEYKLGTLFHFYVDNDRHSAKIRIHGEQLDNSSSLVLSQSGTDKVIASATKNEVKEQLIILGPAVKSSNNSTVTINFETS